MSERMSDALRLEDVVVIAGSTQILDGISLVVPAGRIVAIVGPNGAGKTTLLDVVSGVVRATSGTVAVGGNGNGRRIGRVFQGSPLPETMTVAEVAALATGGRATAMGLLDRFGLAPHASSFVAELSTGMRRILDLAVATVGQPGMLLLDEPASGLAQSEIEHLARLVRAWRDSTGSAVIIVEHDASLVKALADEVVVLKAGRIAAQGTVRKVLASSRAKSQPRIRSPHDERFRAALDRVSAGAVATAGLPKRTLSKWTLMRLGLREMAAGMGSVLILGVLSRVLTVELGVTLGVVTMVLASYNLAAPIAVAVGHRSDTRPIFGRRRTPYIIGGAVITGLAVAAAPHIAGRLTGGVTAGAVILSVLLFIAMGFGMYGSGTVFFALITDLCSPSERGHAASVVYLELMVGVLAGVALTGIILKDGATNIGTLFGVVGFLVAAMSTVAVWGMDKKIPPQEHAPAGEGPSLRSSIRAIAAMPQARSFFAFMVLSTLFLFLQQAILSPFGGEVLHLSLRATTSFSAMLTIGAIAGMVVAGRPFAEQIGHGRIAVLGLGGSAVAFAGLAAAAGTRAAAPAWLSILFLGFMSGLFNVSSLALMMGMSDRRRTALFMGAWTLAHALADGSATAGGGLIFEAARRIIGSVPGGYASVFALEAVGLALCIPLLRRVDVGSFAAQVAGPPPGELVLVEEEEAKPKPRPKKKSGAVKKAAGNGARASGSSPRRSSGASPRRRTGAGS